MIKILILSRRDLHHQRKNIPQEDIDINQLNSDAYMLFNHHHYVIFQEGDGPVTVLKDRSDYPIKTLLEEVVKEMR